MKKTLFLITLIALPLCGSAQSEEIKTILSDSSTLRKHVTYMVQTEEPRSEMHVDQLQKVSAYIYEVLDSLVDTVYYQNYSAPPKSFRNVVGVLGRDGLPIVVIGAHYDVCGEQQGADDNASGVAGLLELARMLKVDTTKQYHFVAYSTEEPPYFRTEHMGSFVHADSIQYNPLVQGMVCLEMIGYFSEMPNSQSYPLKAMKKKYGDKGNFIAAIGKWGGGKWAMSFMSSFDTLEFIPTVVFSGPSNMVGVDFSDHLNYWNADIPAVMITDTSFYRNRNYHQASDTIDTLDFQKMALVVNTVFSVLVAI